MDQKNPLEEQYSDKKALAVIFLATFSILIVLLIFSVLGFLYVKNNQAALVKDTDQIVQDLSTEFLADEQPAGPELIVSPSPTPEPLLDNRNTKTTVIAPTQVPRTCYKYTIYEGKFKSSKCYSEADYDALFYYTSKYSAAAFTKESAESTIDFTCDEDYFKDSCDEAKERRDKAEDDLKNYTNEINLIIFRGW